ncbi:unnamed protein product, partial [Prorocentrum cordatum]
MSGQPERPRPNSSPSFRPHRIPKDDKEAWENVPTIVFQSIKSLDKNAPEIKAWIDQHEKRARDIEEQLRTEKGRADEHGAALHDTREQLAELTRATREAEERRHREAAVFQGCLGSLLRAEAALVGRLGRFFGACADRPDGAGDAAGPLPQGEDGLAALEALGRGAGDRLDVLAGAFGRWEAQRADEESARAATDAAVVELRAGAEQSQSRLLAWRDLLKENSAVIEALNSQLDTTKLAVQDLLASRVRQVDVEDAVGASARQLEGMHASLDGRVEELARLFDEHAERTDGTLEEARRATDAQINEHSSQVAQLLERSLHPINAYLNTMRVKADQARVELDSLSARVPELAESLRGTAARLEEGDARHGERADELAHELADLAKAQLQQSDLAQQQGEELAEQVCPRTAGQGLHEQIALIRGGLQNTERELDTLRQRDVARLTTELKTLEERVAQWVHTRPLPAKISEARLFSLETRLNEEMN